MSDERDNDPRKIVEYARAIKVFRDAIFALSRAMADKPTPDVIEARVEDAKRAADALVTAYGNYWFWRERQASSGDANG